MWFSWFGWHFFIILKCILVLSRVFCCLFSVWVSKQTGKKITRGNDVRLRCQMRLAYSTTFPSPHGAINECNQLLVSVELWYSKAYLNINTTHDRLLADRTNGHAYATVLRPSSSVAVVCLWRWLNCVCVLEQKLQLTSYRKSHMRNRFVPKWMTFTFVLEVI